MYTLFLYTMMLVESCVAAIGALFFTVPVVHFLQGAFKMKKIITVLLCACLLLCFFGCGNEETFIENNTAPKTEQPSDEKKYEFDEYEGYEIVFKIPKGWERFSQNDYDNMMQHIYAPADSGEYKDNLISIYSFTNLKNQYNTMEDAEYYLEEQMKNFFQNIEGSMTYTEIATEKYDSTVPAMYGNFIQNWNGKEREMSAYFFILSEKTIFMINYTHDINSSVDYYDEYDKIIESLEFEPFLSSNEHEEYNSSDNEDGFTNKYGTPTTKCAHSGCGNYIASSGDTNCCESHSNICLECYKYIDEDAMYCMDCLTEAIQESGSGNSFTNKYGTPTTKCAHSGCSNYIASSGDTNCCESHSNRCLQCNKYIDEDALFCMSCLS